MKPIVFATQNSGKLEEMRYILRHWDAEILSIKDIGLSDLEVEENGSDYLENALIKARAVKALTDFAVLSDDSGMEVAALNGRPGIYSARYGGDIPFSEKRKLLLQEMEGKTDRKAYFRCALAFIDETEYLAEGSVEGVISSEERGEWGFGYDAIFELPDGRTFGEIPFEEKHNMSHRYLAVKALEKVLLEDSRHF